MMNRYVVVMSATALGMAVVALGEVTARVASKPDIPLAAEKWTASDEPYAEVRSRIKAEYAQGKDPQVVAQEYRTNAALHPSDPVAQFAWTCAARGAGVTDGTWPSKAFSFLSVLKQADPGNVHEFTRYRFCVSDEASIQIPLHEVKVVGDRLLDYNHSDNWVCLSMINQLCNYTVGASQALPYASAWVSREPKSESSHSALALVYFDMWQASHRKDHASARKALVEYQTYLRLASPSDKFRKPAEAYIKNIQRMEAQQG